VDQISLLDQTSAGPPGLSSGTLEDIVSLPPGNYRHIHEYIYIIDQYMHTVGSVVPVLESFITVCFLYAHICIYMYAYIYY
jgi:hypothetical protein